MVSARAGAVGADGRRPILAWAGAAPHPPDPQQSHAASGTAASAAAAAPNMPTAGPRRGGGAEARTGADGFTTVLGRNRARAAQPQAAAAAPAPAAAAAPVQPAAAGDMGIDDAGGPEDDGLDGDARDDASGGGRTAAASTGDGLKEAWQEAQQLVESLVQRGLPEGHPVREAARQQAEAAKAAWESVRPGVGVPKRLVYAEQALARAKRSQSKMEQSIDDLDMEYEAERARRVQALHELRARTKQRERFLADLSRQAAEEFRGGGGGDATAERQTEVAVETMEGPIRDAIQEALNAATEGTDLHTRLSGALGTLGDLTSSMQSAARSRWADCDPSQEDDDGDQWEEGWWGGCDGGRWYSNPWAMEQEAYYDADDPNVDAAMDTGDVAVPQWLATSGHGDADDPTHARAGKRWCRGGGGAEEVHGWQHGGDGMHQGHRGAAASAALQAGVAGAAGSGAEVPAPPTPNMAEMALERKRQEVWDYAQDRGAQISSDEIARMSMEELEEWQAACLL